MILDSEQQKWIQNQLNDAIALHRKGKFNPALIKYTEILEIDPGHADSNHLAGLALLARKQPGDLQRSLKYLSTAINIDDSQSAFHNDLGNAYWNLGQIPEAAEAFSRAISLDPEFVQPRFNLANCYWFEGHFKLARQAYADTLTVNGNWAQARYMLASCEYTLGHSNTAISIYRDVISTRPDLIDAQLGLAYALLRTGQWQEGWRYFESRLLFSEFSLYQNSILPEWDGRDIGGKSLLVFSEQGIGDTLHFIRYLSLVRPKVGRLELVCDRSLHTLFSRQTEIDVLHHRDAHVVQSIEKNNDYRISLMSLPNLFQTRSSSSWNVPYIKIDKRKTESWNKRLDSNKVNVGLVWAGNPSQKDDKFRSCKLKDLLPLLKLSHIQFYSLQVGKARAQLQENKVPSLIDLSGELKNFDDTAAVINALDLVISVDTAVAHLAGSIGKPVWTMLWYSHCWRYLETRTDSPWYPTMQLFRQRDLGNWAYVVDLIRTALSEININKTLL